MSIPLEIKLKEIGFEQIQFEPKTNSKFFVKLDGIPSYAIKGVRFPPYQRDSIEKDPGWCKYIPLSLEIYNVLGESIEQKCFDIISKSEVQISISLLTSDGEVDTTWQIVAKGTGITFDNLDWSDNQVPNKIYLKFQIKTATVSY